MPINFNNHRSEYELFNGMTSELISSFGVYVTYLKTKFCNVDQVLGDIGHYSVTTPEQVIEDVPLLPEHPEGFQAQDNLLSNFGLINLDSMDFFMSRDTLDRIYEGGEFNRCAGDLIVLPSGKIMQITNIKAQVPGANNEFLYANQKNVYQITTKTYHHKGDEISADVELPKSYNDEVEANKNGFLKPETMDSLDELFNRLGEEAKKEQQDRESTVVKNVDSVFGDLG